MLEIKDFLLIAVSGIAGLVFGQANGFFERRNLRRQAISRALSELLEIRHRFRSSLYVISRIGAEAGIPDEHIDSIIAKLPEGALWEDGISDRFNEAVTALSSHAPILAYALRSKDIVRVFCNGMPFVFGSSPLTRRATLDNIELIKGAISPAIDEVIIGVSKLINKKTSRAVLEILEASDAPDPVVVATTNEVLANVIRAAQSSS